ncbi:hypothetical protein NE237_021412 [Protea cynaroides]|uniref:Uncharacterized protein n=1 Tax=Protea cynaroides TaxID=273540 RepID=A0A9Q0K3I1_9MAGN|nr:hypothetical protein NE237_021412 [Protea cynaroides]
MSALTILSGKVLRVSAYGFKEDDCEGQPAARGGRSEGGLLSVVVLLPGVPLVGSRSGVGGSLESLRVSVSQYDQRLEVDLRSEVGIRRDPSSHLGFSFDVGFLLVQGFLDNGSACVMGYLVGFPAGFSKEVEVSQRHRAIDNSCPMVGGVVPSGDIFLSGLPPLLGLVS